MNLSAFKDYFWKSEGSYKANIATICKKGNKNMASNFQPVSLKCICCKLMLTRHRTLGQVSSNYHTPS